MKGRHTPSRRGAGDAGPVWSDLCFQPGGAPHFPALPPEAACWAHGLRGVCGGLSPALSSPACHGQLVIKRWSVSHPPLAPFKCGCCLTSAQGTVYLRYLNLYVNLRNYSRRGKRYLKTVHSFETQNLLVDEDEDFSTVRDDVGREKQKQLALGKKER